MLVHLFEEQQTNLLEYFYFTKRHYGLYERVVIILSVSQSVLLAACNVCYH